MRIRVEQIFIWCGIFGLSPNLLIAYLGTETPRYLIELFRGGSVAGVIVGLLFMLGFLGLCMYFINIARAQRGYWWQRLISLLIFVFSASIVGVSF